MKKFAIALIVGAVGATASAQSALDYRTLSSSQLRGTARYMSMAGAFGALGGDISTLTQNPAGIGIYRSSEVAATLDIDSRRITLDDTGFDDPYRHKQTNVACNNFGYVGSVRTGSEVMPFFQWGASYSRLNSFNRYYRGYFPVINTSWTNYVAASSAGYSPGELEGTKNYDPFFDSDADWLSVLAFNTRLINFTGDGYTGLFKLGSTGNAETEVQERGYVDEYSINFGGNFSDMIYWGIGFGIRDLSFSRVANYNEQISDANIRYGSIDNPQMGNGAAEWGIDSYQSVSGTGFNMKFGLIFKPINELRFGLAVHTPTWYSLQCNQSANITYGLGMPPTPEYDYYTFDNIPGGSEADNPYAETTTGYWTRNFKSPWRLMASAATVLGGRFILSADYIYEAYPQMGDSGFDASAAISQDVKQYYSGSNELRLGAEVRVTPAFSIRGGYGIKTSGVTTETKNGDNYIYTSGVCSMYTLDGNRQNITAGIGYRWKSVYVDLAYVHSTSTAQWNAFSPFPHLPEEDYQLAGNAQRGPQGKLTDTSNRFAVTLGFRF